MPDRRPRPLLAARRRCCRRRRRQALQPACRPSPAALYSVVSRVSVSWSLRALPALAALALLRSGQLCGVLARAPDAGPALERLFHSLSLLK